MKQYEVTLTGHYEKTISVYADSPEQAAEKLKIILFDTDLIDFSDEDFVCGEADIAEADGDGEKEIDPSDEDEDEIGISQSYISRLEKKIIRRLKTEMDRV